MRSIQLILLSASDPPPVRGLLIVGTAMVVSILGLSLLLRGGGGTDAAGNPKVDVRIPAFVIVALISTLLFFFLLFKRIA